MKIKSLALFFDLQNFYNYKIILIIWQVFGHFGVSISRLKSSKS